MPIDPQPKETQSEFVSRCIAHELNKGTTTDPKQAAAICYGYWRDKDKKKETK